MDRNGEDWTGDDISEKASAPGGVHDDESGEKPADDESEGPDEGSDPKTDIEQYERGKRPAKPDKG